MKYTGTVLGFVVTMEKWLSAGSNITLIGVDVFPPSSWPPLYPIPGKKKHAPPPPCQCPAFRVRIMASPRETPLLRPLW